MVTPAPQLIQSQSPAPGQSVSVWKEFSETARGFLFRKTWQSQPGPAAKAWLSWAHHEHLLLTLLAHRDAKHVVQVAGLQVQAEQVEVVTLDAGLDFQRDWLDRVALQGEPLFLQPTEALKFARACLCGLLSIHKIDMMHGDIKSDNLCIHAKTPVGSTNGTTGAGVGSRLVLDLDSLRWIDFAYAVCREPALKFVLPTDPDRLAYLPEPFRMAIRTAQATGDPMHIQRAACAQVDLFGLWCMLSSAVVASPTDGGWAVWHAWLKSCKKLATQPFNGSAPFEAPTQQLLSETEITLAQLQVPAAQWGEATTALRAETGVVQATPLLPASQTPLLTPLLPSLQALPATQQVPVVPTEEPLAPASSVAAITDSQPQTNAPTALLASVRQSGVYRQRGWLGIAVLSLLFVWIDQRYVQMGLKLSDLGFALGLLAMVLAIPAILGTVWHALTRASTAQAWARYSGLSLCGIAAYFSVLIFSAGAPVLPMAGVFLLLTLLLVALLF